MVAQCAVDLAMELYTKPSDDVSKWKLVNCEKGWTKHRALGDPTSDSMGEGSSDLLVHKLIYQCRAVPTMLMSCSRQSRMC